MRPKGRKGNVPKEVNMWETFRKEEVLKKLKTNLRTGLSEEEVVFRRSKYGKNKLEEKKKETLMIKFFKQFNDFMIIIFFNISFCCICWCFIFTRRK